MGTADTLHHTPAPYYDVFTTLHLKADFVGTAKEVYRLSLEGMDECDQLSRGDPAWQASAAARWGGGGGGLHVGC